MRDRSVDAMRTYWDDRAKTNAAWYVDTSLDYDHPDMERFWQTGRAIVADALDHSAPAAPSGTDLAVEIGAGLGRVCVALAERFDRVIGVDISAEMVRQARDAVGTSNVSFVVGDGETLAGVTTASADLVLSFTVFQHIATVAVTERYLAEAGRVLKPGGLLVFQWNNEPGARRWRVRRAVLSALQRLGIRTEPLRRHDPAFLGTRVPLARITRALAAGGLRLEGTRGEGTLYAWAWATRVPFA
ncbi:MAG: class I SAM-dependent methyltransferase [Acidimicrobiales bacterium]